MNNCPDLTDATLEVRDRIAVLTMNRDDVRNALTGTALVDDIETTVRWANASKDVSVLVLTGNGSAFSAGGNIKEMQNKQGIFAGTAQQIETGYRKGIQRMTVAMSQIEVPVIAAVNGPAIGAGFDLACMCDLRLASTDAVIGETFINLGIIPGDGGAWFLQRLVGYQRAAELTFTGRLVTAVEAFDLGLFLEVVEPERLMSRTLDFARQIAEKPPLAVRKTKQIIGMARTSDLADILRESATYQAALHQTDDHLEAVNAFLEKRKGIFTGG